MSKKNKKKSSKPKLNVTPAAKKPQVVEPPRSDEMQTELPSGPLTMTMGLYGEQTLHFGLPDLRTAGLGIDDLQLDAETAEEQKQQSTVLMKRIQTALEIVDHVDRSLAPLKKQLQHDLSVIHKEIQHVEKLMQTTTSDKVPSLDLDEQQSGEWA